MDRNASRNFCLEHFFYIPATSRKVHVAVFRRHAQRVALPLATLMQRIAFSMHDALAARVRDIGRNIVARTALKSLSALKRLLPIGV